SSSSFCSKVYQFGELKNLIDKSNKAKYTVKSIPCVNEFFFNGDLITVFYEKLPKILCTCSALSSRLNLCQVPIQTNCLPMD
ncbi:hypothetical protein BpHYR1_023169, partial [Brachionus plicatilis]